MILRFYRRGAEGAREQITQGQGTGSRGYAEPQVCTDWRSYADQQAVADWRACTDWRACAEFSAGDTGGRQLLLDFEEDRICIVREVRRNGCIGGSRPWSTPEAPWPARLQWPQQGSVPGNDDCA